MKKGMTNSPARGAVRRDLARILAVATVALAVLSSSAFAQSPTTVSADSRTVIISKDVGGQRWAISRDLRTLAVTGNVFSPSGGPPQFVWCAQTAETKQNISLACYGAGPCAQVGCADTWRFIANVDLPPAFFAAGASGDAGLNGLVGSWSFYYFYPSPFSDDYDLISSQVQNGVPVLIGRDDFDDPVVAARALDLLPGSASPYEFVMLDPGSTLCRAFAFDRTGDQLFGVYFQLDTRDDGNCDTDNLGRAYDARGIRRAVLPVPGAEMSALDGSELVATAAHVPTDQRAWIVAALEALVQRR